MKQLLRNKIHNDIKSHDVTFVEHKGMKIKMTYESYVGGEKYTSEIFDGTKWNSLFNLMDLGELPSGSTYLESTSQREEKANRLFLKAKSLIEKII